jgi:peptide-methionine (S)-S-oxide reductase
MRVFLPLVALALAACGSGYQPEVPKARAETASGRAETAIFAGGCFWCTEADFEKVPGVTAAVSGYTGGSTANPTYEQVSAGGTGHYEAVRVTYDPARVSYRELTRYFVRTVDPTDSGGQFCDRGESYRTAIFAADPAQSAAAQAALADAGKTLRQPLATPVLPAARFYPAEDYHQDYYRKNKLKYNFYRSRCGRDARLAQVWGNKAS